MEYLLIGAIILLSLAVHNMPVAYAAVIVLVLRLFNLTKALDTLSAQGVNWGIIILTTSILVPIANGSITWKHITGSFQTLPGISAIIAGILAAIAGSSGVTLLKDAPEIAASLIIGTMIGVVVFKGIPVGPLIAGGVTYFLICVLSFFNR